MQSRLKGTTFDFFREMNGAPAKNCSGPEKRDTSILLCKNIANAMIFSIVFDRGVRLRRVRRGGEGGEIPVPPSSGTI